MHSLTCPRPLYPSLPHCLPRHHLQKPRAFLLLFINFSLHRLSILLAPKSKSLYEAQLQRYDGNIIAAIWAPNLPTFRIDGISDQVNMSIRHEQVPSHI